jgi:magnesium chelatase subunit H
VRFGVQPALGVEGDPMRLLFDRDLTPHPSYAAFYLHLRKEFKAHALGEFFLFSLSLSLFDDQNDVDKRKQKPHSLFFFSFPFFHTVHLGMHGTVEWLPGSPLGSTALSWPDVLLGDLPNA